MKFYRLYESLNSSELSMIKMSLSAENIHYRVLFENTLQTANVYALGNTGAIIEVAENDLEQAKQIMLNLGIVLDYNGQLDKFRFINRFDHVTRYIPFLGSLQVGIRLAILASIIFGIGFLLIVLSTLRIKPDSLAGNFWCVDEIIYKGEILKPTTIRTFYTIGVPGISCADIFFRETGTALLPGFNTFYISATWTLDKAKNKLNIHDADQFKEIYNGEYQIERNWSGTMKLVSSTTSITISQK